MCRTAHAILSVIICGIQMLVRVFMTFILMMENIFRLILQMFYNLISFLLQMLSLLPICVVFLLTTRLKCFMCGGGGPCPVNRGGGCDCLMSLLGIILLFFVFRAVGLMDKIFYRIGYVQAGPPPPGVDKFAPTPGDVRECSRGDHGHLPSVTTARRKSNTIYSPFTTTAWATIKNKLQSEETTQVAATTTDTGSWSYDTDYSTFDTETEQTVTETYYITETETELLETTTDFYIETSETATELLTAAQSSNATTPTYIIRLKFRRSFPEDKTSNFNINTVLKANGNDTSGNLTLLYAPSELTNIVNDRTNITSEASQEMSFKVSPNTTTPLILNPVSMNSTSTVNVSDTTYKAVQISTEPIATEKDDLTYATEIYIRCVDGNIQINFHRIEDTKLTYPNLAETESDSRTGKKIYEATTLNKSQNEMDIINKSEFTTHALKRKSLQTFSDVVGYFTTS